MQSVFIQHICLILVILGLVMIADKLRLADPIVLAWLLARKPWIAPITVTTKLHRLEENIRAISVKLTPNDLRDIDDAASQITWKGRDTLKS